MTILAVCAAVLWGTIALTQTATTVNSMAAPSTTPKTEEWNGDLVLSQLRTLNEDVFLAAIGASGGQDRGLTGEGVTVAVVDSGLDTSAYAPKNVVPGQHLYYLQEDGGELRLRTHIFEDQWFNFYTNPDTSDDVGHGTAVTSVITQIAPNVTIMPIKVCEDPGLELDGGPIGNQEGNVSAGIEWAVDHGADIICCSLGFDNSCPELEAAVKKAEEAGVTVVAAAGNPVAPIDSGKESYPAALPTVVSVGMVDPSGAIGNRFEPSVDVYAPGYGIFVYLPCPNACISQGAGTSYACPQVVGAAALYKELCPGATPADLRTALAETCDKFENLDPTEAVYAGWGTLNIENLLEYGETVSNTMGHVVRVSLSSSFARIKELLSQTVKTITPIIGRYNGILTQ